MLVGCDNGDTPAAPPTDAPIATPELALPECGQPPSPAPDAAPPGAVIPPATRLTAVRDQHPLVQLNAYTEMTPIEIRVWVEEHPDLQVIVSEDEVFESELLVSDGEWRTFIKARAVCATASVVAEVIAPEDSDVTLPTPAGSPPPR